MRAHVSGVMGVMLSLLAAPGSAEEVEPVGATRAETVRLHAELVLLRRIRSAQRGAHRMGSSVGGRKSWRTAGGDL